MTRPSFPLLVALLTLAATASARDWKALKPQGYVSDFANVVDTQSRMALEHYGTQLEQSTGAQIAFVTLPTLEGEPIEDVANDLFHAWGIGQKGKDNGILLLLVVQDHRSRLEVGHGLEEILPDGFDGLLLNNMRPDLRAGNYGAAMLTAAQAIGDPIAKAKHVDIGTPVPGVRKPIQTTDDVPWVEILFGLLVFFLLLRSASRGYSRGGPGGLLANLVLGNLLSNVTYSGRGGGGFGGYDSGGSTGGFGGFGGGDSGGGGASSDW